MTTITTESKNVSAMNNIVPQTPKWLEYVYIVQATMSIILLGLNSYAISIFSDLYYITSALGFSVFVCIWTLLFCIALLSVTRYLPQLYYKWLILGAMSLTTFVWLISFSTLATWANSGWVLHWRGSLSFASGCIVASSILGAFIWVSWVVCLVFYGLGCHRARMADSEDVEHIEAKAVTMRTYSTPSPTPIYTQRNTSPTFCQQNNTTLEYS